MTPTPESVREALRAVFTAHGHPRTAIDAALTRKRGLWGRRESLLRSIALDVVLDLCGSRYTATDCGRALGIPPNALHHRSTLYDLADLDEVLAATRAQLEEGAGCAHPHT